MLDKLFTIIRYDLKQVFARKGSMYTPIIFFIISIFLFPFTSAPDNKILYNSMTTIILISTLFASFISINQIFDEDFRDGTIEQFLLSGVESYIIVLGKVIVHWLVSSLPIILAIPVIGIIFNVDNIFIILMVLVIILITPILSCIGCFGSSITMGMPKGGAVSSLVTMPLSISILVFGSLAVTEANGTISNSIVYFEILAGIFLIMFPMSIFFSSLLISSSTNTATK